jgi:hypothetical protein
MPPKLCLSLDQLAYLELCFEELMNKNLNLHNNLGLLFAQKYPNLNLSYKTLIRRYEEYIQHKKHHSTNMRNKNPVIYNILQENNKLDCFYGQKSLRFVKMNNKRFFKTNKEKILEIQKVKKESAVKKIRVTKPYYYNINKRSQFLSKIVNITSKKNKISKLNKKTISIRIIFRS